MSKYYEDMFKLTRITMSSLIVDSETQTQSYQRPFLTEMYFRLFYFFLKTQKQIVKFLQVGNI